MVSAENFKKELSKYNEELKEHISSIPIEVSENMSYEKLSDTQATNYEVLSFIQDIRDEMSLLRKHLYNDVQSLVTKTLRAEQESHLDEMRKNFNSMIGEMADSKNYILNKVRDETAQMHHDIKNSAIDLETINSKIDTLVQAVYDANKNQITIQDEVSYKLKEIESELLVNQHAIDGFNNSLKKELMHEQQNNLNTLNFNSNNTLPSQNRQMHKQEDRYVEHRIARIDAALHKLDTIDN